MGRVANTNIAGAGGTLNQDLDTGAEEWLTVIAVVGSAANAASAAGDVSVNVLPYLDDATGPLGARTLSPLNLPTADAVAAVLSSSRAYILGRFRISGLSKVQIQAKNNNAAAKPVEINYFTG